MYTIRIELFSSPSPVSPSILNHTSFYSRFFFLFLIMRKCCCCCCHCSRYFRKEKRATSTLFPKQTYLIRVHQLYLKSSPLFNPPLDPYLIPSSYFHHLIGTCLREMVIQTLWWKWLDDERFSSVSATESVWSIFNTCFPIYKRKIDPILWSPFSSIDYNPTVEISRRTRRSNDSDVR